jgi:DNA-binding XRE family transcriptional regulator
VKSTTQNDDNFEKYISHAEAARIIGATSQSVAILVRQGYFTTATVGGRILILRSEAEKYVARPKGRPRKKEFTEKELLKKRFKTTRERGFENYLSQAEAARHRGVSKQAIANLIRRGKLNPVIVAGRNLVLRTEVEAFVPQSKPGLAPRKAASKGSAKAKSSRK